MNDIEVTTDTRSSKRTKVVESTHENLPVLLIVHGFGGNETMFLVSDHHILDGVYGHHNANKRIGLFFSDSMEKFLLEEIGDDVQDLGTEGTGDYAKQSLLFEMFFGDQMGGRRPKRKEMYRATISLYIEPARFRSLK